VKRTPVAAAVVALAAVFLVASPAAAQTAPAPGGVVEAGYTSLRATVLKIDLATRNVELKDETGKVFSITVRDEVKNLDQVRPGDVVVARMTDSLAYEIKAPGTAKPGEKVAATGDAGRAGEKPKGTARKVTTKTVTVTAIDTKTSTVTFRTATGETKTTVVKEPSRLVGVKVGDLVELTYTEAIAFSVEKAPAKK
jgi:hypothetical protein